jgi:hypothetical protein
MALKNFRKETSERSDSLNWTKDILSKNTGLFFESVEGCNQNKDNVVTHLFERMRVDFDSAAKGTLSEVLTEIIVQEGIETLQRKINFCKTFGLNLSYVLYCDETEKVYLFELESIDELQFKQIFESYAQFSTWIGTIKGWVSTKPFRENQDLPYFDKALRKAGTAWPTNIDCFVCDAQSEPIGIIEFQNTKNVSVETHSNNDFFLCKYIKSNDIRRWFSQEILRVQSGLRLFVITWSQNENGYKLDEIDKIISPSFFNDKLKIDWGLKQKYELDLHNYTLNPSNETIKSVSKQYNSVSINYEKITKKMEVSIHKSPLNLANKTFPSIYYLQKKFVKNNQNQLLIDFMEMMANDK